MKVTNNPSTNISRTEGFEFVVPIIGTDIGKGWRYIGTGFYIYGGIIATAGHNLIVQKIEQSYGTMLNRFDLR
jgi:hypothetical protein